MPNMCEPLIFDGHNDVLLKLYNADGPDAINQFTNGQHGQIDLPRAREGGFGGGFFAIYVPPLLESDDHDAEMQRPRYDLPLPSAIPVEKALPVVMQQAAILLKMQAAGHLRICVSTDDIRASFTEGRLAAIMHIEGAEGLDADLHNLDVLYAAGLRSLGPVWSRPTIFGEGVPFRYPSDGNIGGGLTDAGKNLIRRCNDLNIMVDLSHLNEAGFWDVAKISTAPLVATHSNAYALCHHARNLTDPQLEAIAASDGMVGLNFATAFLRKDGQMRPDVPFSTMLAHLDHLIDKLGVDRVGFGSDFDGAMVPEAIGDVAGLGKLRNSMIDHGYSESLMRKLCNENWLRVLARTWGEQAKT